VTDLFGPLIFDNIEIELPFKNGRRADIAFLNNGNVVALVEVKYEDQKSERNHAQFQDYIYFCTQHHIPFRVITKEPLPYKEELLLKKNNAFAKSFSYGHIIHRIKALKLSHDAIARMVCEYLEQEALMFTRIRKEDLQLLMLNALNVRYNHGLGKQRTRDKILKVGDTLKGMISNVTLIGDDIHNSCMESRLFPKRPPTSFFFSPQFSTKDVARLIKEWEKNPKRDTEIDSQKIRAGRLVVSYGYTIKDEHGNGRCFLEFGIIAELKTTRKSRPVETYLYAEINPYGLEEIATDKYLGDSESINTETINDMEAIKTVRRLLKNTLRYAIAYKLPRGVNTKLNHVYKNLQAR